MSTISKMIREGCAFFFPGPTRDEAGTFLAGSPSGEISQDENAGSSTISSNWLRERGGPSMTDSFQRKKKSSLAGSANFLLAQARKLSGTSTLFIRLLKATNLPSRVVVLSRPINISIGMPVAASVESEGYSTREGARPKFQRSR